MSSKIINYIVERFQSDDLVNTITLSDSLVVDTSKENVYPIVAINYESRSGDSELENHFYNFRILVLQQRDTKPEMKNSKLMDTTNWIDNLNDCESIINRFTNYIERLDVDSNITIETLSDLTPLDNYGGNRLDGFSFDITLRTSNTGYCDA